MSETPTPYFSQEHFQLVNAKPYRITVGVPRDDRVTQRSLLPRWRELEQLTLIARANIGLMFKILELFGSLPSAADGGSILESPTKNVAKHDVKAENTDDNMRVAGVGDAAALPQEFPKIHINSGRSSGIHIWKKIMNEVEDIERM